MSARAQRVPTCVITKKAQTMMHITQRIFQGGYITPNDARELRDQGVTDLLNLDIPYLAADAEHYQAMGLTCHLCILRDKCPVQPQEVDYINDLFDQILSNPACMVYIHCNAGVSRSPTIAYLYLLHIGYRRPTDIAAPC